MLVHPLSSLDRAFPLAARLRGAEVHRADAVRFLAGDARTVRAEVRGRRGLHAVTVRLDRGRVAMSCSCATFAAGHGCHHLWATLLVARDRGALGGVLVAAPLASPDELPAWRRRIEAVRQAMQRDRSVPATVPDAIAFTIDVARTRALGELAGVVEEPVPGRKTKTGAASKSTRWRPLRLTVDALPALPERWRELLALLEGATTFATGVAPPDAAAAPDATAALSTTFTLPGALATTALARMAEAGVLRVRIDEEASVAAALELEPPRRFVLVVERASDAEADEEPDLVVRGELRGRVGDRDEVIDVADPLALTPSGWAITQTEQQVAVLRCELAGAARLATQLRDQKRLVVPANDAPALWEALASLPALPPLDVRPGIALEQIAPALVPHLRLEPLRARLAPPGARPSGWVGKVAFGYDDVVAGADEARAGLFVPERQLFVRRKPLAEGAAFDRLEELGAEPAHEIDGSISEDPERWELAARDVPNAVRALVAEGWHVEADGRRYRRAGEAKLAVRSGIDWFDLEGGANFDGAFVPLPELLAALRDGREAVTLPDGTLGLLPEGWLPQHALISSLGQIEDGRLRFGRAQAALLDALLADASISIDSDEAFARARQELSSFDGIDPIAAPDGFDGSLRPYQELGLGWFAFLRRFGFGGCLADDMGLGKTVQVLALLAARRHEAKGPSIVVVPRSLLANWQREAARFAPGLRVRLHHGPDRARDAASVTKQVDLLVTTYGTLRNDAAWMSTITFDYAILDEAQTIKNAESGSAKAARLLRAQHRLALTGTPIENHLDELWSLFDFLNPGMLGPVRDRAGADAQDPAALARLAALLRPFILRRTKEEVARELPEKREELLLVELDGAQRRLYDELRDSFRASLLAGTGGGPTTMHILEALLRLRQAACHPGLVDPSRAGEESAKLEVLMPRLQELAETGHKALVFSQFTSFLALVRARLDAAGIAYEYLDGRTRDRAARVDRFQTDPACPLFLVSLKAGGVGLNLTAADYVFLLDPWWNPAAEAQAVDRAHRIGQQRPVLVYRLVCRDTVEEKVLELQRGKRALADAVLGGDGAAAKAIDREALRELLG